MENIGKLSEEALKNYLLEETQALCIVNTKKRAQKIYHELKGRVFFIYLQVCIQNTENVY